MKTRTGRQHTRGVLCRLVLVPVRAKKKENSQPKGVRASPVTIERDF